MLDLLLRLCVFKVQGLHIGEKMYRQYLHEKQVEGDWFMSRVCELPVVNSAVEQLTALYSGVKQHNRVFRFTLDTAEGGMHMVYQTACPVVSKFDKPIGTLNGIACQQLDKLQHECPIITKPTAEVLKETKQLCTSAVEPLISSVNAVKQYGVDKVTNASEKVTSMKEYGVSTLATMSDLGTRQVTRALESPVCRQSVCHLDMVLDAAHHCVDTLLPESEMENDAPVAEKPLVDDDGQEKKATVMVKAANLSNKVRRRMYGHIASQLRTVKLRTAETVEHLNFTVNLIEYSRAMMNNTTETAAYIWTEINKTDDEVAKELTDEDSEACIHANSNFGRRAIATARHLTQKSKQMVSSVGLPLSKVPGMVQPVRDLVASCVASPVSGMSAFGRHTVHIFGQYHVFITEKSSSLFGWIITTAPVQTLAPVLGSVVTTSCSESDSFRKPAIELSNMPCAEAVSKEQPLTGYSSNESLDDDDREADEN